MSKVLIVGDLMLDEFIYGEVSRISPEAATPVLSASHTERMIGGAGNVARGVAALDCECDLISVMGSDDASRVLMRELRKIDRITPYISIDMARATTHKMRFVSEQHSSHLLRVDAECTVPVSGDVERLIRQRAIELIVTEPDLRVVVLSDYCKGALTGRAIRGIIGAARSGGKIVIVDSKRKDLEVFRGAGYLKLNLDELGASDEATEREHAARRIMREHGIGSVIVTRGEDGLSVYGLGTVHIPGKRVRVRDVSGAGDTFVAAFAVGLAGDVDVIPALHHANEAASIAVSKPGTSAVTTAELRGTKIVPHDNLALLDQRLIEWRGQRIGFTNGCFDLLHPGHVHMLEQARSHCGKLIVGLNSDASVKHLKGPTRPIQNAESRAAVLAALDSVDLVVVFNRETPIELIEHIKPDVLVKGGDYTAKEIVGHEHAGCVVVVEHNGHSTTDIAKRAGLPATVCPGPSSMLNPCSYPQCGCPTAMVDGPSGPIAGEVYGEAGWKPSGGGFSQSSTPQEREARERSEREHLPWVRGTED